MTNTATERHTILTDRQREIVSLIAAGCSNEELGRRLGISPRTAKHHCDVLRHKLGVTRRRYIPAAYRQLTGEDPLQSNSEIQLSGASGSGRTGLSDG